MRVCSYNFWRSIATLAFEYNSCSVGSLLTAFGFFINSFGGGGGFIVSFGGGRCGSGSGSGSGGNSFLSSFVGSGRGSVLIFSRSFFI